MKRGQNFKKNPQEKGVVFNSQNYNEYPLLMALILPGADWGADRFMSGIWYHVVVNVSLASHVVVSKVHTEIISKGACEMIRYLPNIMIVS